MRKGATLEKNIDKLIDFLAFKSIHGHKNNALRLVGSGQTVKGEPFDYEIFAPSKVHCFDVKECAGERWNLKTNAKPAQINALIQCERSGAECYFLVYFIQKNKVVKFPVKQVLNAMKAGVKSFSADEGRPFEWKTFLQ